MTADLLARLEEATEGSRELDFAIAEHLGMHPCWSKSTTGAKKMHRHVGGGPIPAWTSRLDAARVLVPWGVRIDLCWRQDRKGKQDACWAHLESHNGEWEARAHTVELALCIAALRARAEKE